VKREPPTAVEPGGRMHALYTAAVTEMTRRNDVAAEVARAHGVHAATDVTGFGLLGHLHELTSASGLDAVLEVAAVPVLAGVRALQAEGFVPGGTLRNLDHVGPHLDGDDDEATRVLLADAQTSGGLLLALDPAGVDDAVAALTAAGHGAARIGELRTAAGAGGRVTLA
jgi:selenide, water dikinase